MYLLPLSNIKAQSLSLKDSLARSPWPVKCLHGIVECWNNGRMDLEIMNLGIQELKINLSKLILLRFPRPPLSIFPRNAIFPDVRVHQQAPECASQGRRDPGF